MNIVTVLPPMGISFYTAPRIISADGQYYRGLASLTGKLQCTVSTCQGHDLIIFTDRRGPLDTRPLGEKVLLESIRDL